MAFAVTDRGTTRTEQRPGTTTTTTSASFTPTAGALLVCLASGQLSDSSSNSTFSISDTFTGTTGPDGTGTWHQDTVNWLEGTQTTRVSIFTAKLGASPGTGTVTLTFNYASNVNREFTLTVLEVTGQKTANFTNVNSTGNVVATSITVTMGSTPASSSLQVGVCLDTGGNTGNITKPTSWTEVVQKKPTAGGGIHEVAYAIGLATSAPQWTTLSGAGNTQGAMAIEILIAPTAVSSSDTGSGSDSGTVSAAVPSSDTGSGAEGTPSVAFTAADSGSGADSGSLAAAVPSSDTGSGSDTGSLAAAVPSSDAGSGSDAGTIAAAIPSSDTGSAADAGSTAAAIPSSDTGAGSDAGTLAAASSSSDTGSGADSGSAAAAVPSSDTGSGADASGLSAALSSADTASGVEAVTIVVVLSSSDTGSGADAESVTSGTVTPVYGPSTRWREPVAVSWTEPHGTSWREPASFALSEPHGMSGREPSTVEGTDL